MIASKNKFQIKFNKNIKNRNNIFLTAKWNFMRSHPPGNELARGSNTILLTETVKKSIKDAISANSSEDTPIELPSELFFIYR